MSKKKKSCHACEDLSLNSQKQNKAREVARIKFYSDDCNERQTQEKPGRFLLTNIGTEWGVGVVPRPLAPGLKITQLPEP